ncbi:restriction endonuclease subunit S [Xylella fastidiosa]|uniref:restriction endonuclease subunit S n=1 Tax=Xylella fastidiosa TaxID=2371 RepID=UPI0009004A25|nr:restriction endonuclease subunit S [Xylella fastidiosa]MBS9445188.1 restriction endonuclease subunit S [Xylella fastidiosa subsp. multiplex]MBS9446999.1 restriction endonuclease subunit S [Xylella fastidiosa subsp. multiplex]MBS9449094.1 restriction endonuclease subunit S [Xylella fastidiosa subsp. multiplex]MBS9451206.1 restriction endonuclease subunit S [Xylella fastidiosa subsp. multiplex]MBS9485314.1 restriction endonuclease subunit S [Xylella fastidiosa subsp. multiplex]
MAGEWQHIQLAKVCLKIGSGATPRGGKDTYGGGNIALIRSQNIYNNGFTREGLAYINDLQAHDLRNVVVEKNDVLLNITGSVARCCQVDPDVLPARVNQHVAIIRTQPDMLDARFLRYVLISPSMQGLLLAFASAGATRDALTKSMIESLLIQTPPIEEQHAIAKILGTLDDKIELNRRTNETLEAMARALFKAWCVDFEPVRAKLEGRWQRGESLPGLPAHLYDLFPDRLIESELGEIPEGWRYSTIGEEVSVCGGSTPSTKQSEFWEGGCHCWATPKDLSSLRFPVLLDTGRKITDAGLTKISSGLLPVGTVLLSSRAPIGYLAIAQVPTAINQGFIAMKCDGVLPNVFILAWCSESMDAIIGNANGSTFQEISKSNFRPIPVVVPSESVLEIFQKSADLLYRKMTENERESRSLAQLRDTLLPKLISGELRVPDAERITGATL